MSDEACKEVICRAAHGLESLALIVYRMTPAQQKRARQLGLSTLEKVDRLIDQCDEPTVDVDAADEASV